MAGSRKELNGFPGRVLIAAAIFALVWLAWYLRGLLLLAFGAVLVAVILRLLARPIHERLRLSSGLALAIAVLLMLTAIAIVLWLFGAEIGRQTQDLSQTLPAAWQSFEARLAQAGWADELRRVVESFRRGFLANAGRFALSIGNGIADLLLVIFGGIYLAAQPHLYEVGLVKLIPAKHRSLAAEALEDSAKALRLWLKGRLVSMLIVTILTASGLYVIGVPSWLSLGLLSGLLEFIPFIGPIISAFPAVLLALAYSPQAALWTIGLYLVVQQTEGNLVEPLVQQRAVTIPPMVLLFAIVAAAVLFGIGGVLLGAPLTVVIYVLVKRLYVREALDTPTPMPTDHKT